VSISQKCAREQARFAKYLETVADAKDNPAFVRVLDDSLHDGRQAGYGAGTEVVTIRKSAGKYDAVLRPDWPEILVLVPQFVYLRLENLSEDVYHIVIAIRSGENDYTKFHSYAAFCKSTTLIRLPPVEEVICESSHEKGQVDEFGEDFVGRPVDTHAEQTAYGKEKRQKVMVGQLR